MSMHERHVRSPQTVLAFDEMSWTSLFSEMNIFIRVEFQFTLVYASDKAICSDVADALRRFLLQRRHENNDEITGVFVHFSKMIFMIFLWFSFY